MKRRLVFLALTVAMLIALTTTLTVRASTAQTWYLWNDSYSGTAPVDGYIHEVDYLMSVTGTGDAFTLNYISFDEFAWWYTADAASTDVSFGESAWTAHVHYFAPPEGGVLRAEIFSVQGNGTITRLALGSASISGGASGDVTFSLADDGATTQTIPTGDRLAVRLYWNKLAPLEVYYNNAAYDSYVRSPATDPGYPVPEPATIILVGGGLAALAVYLFLQRRKKSYAGA